MVLLSLLTPALTQLKPCMDPERIQPCAESHLRVPVPRLAPNLEVFSYKHSRISHNLLSSYSSKRNTYIFSLDLITKTTSKCLPRQWRCLRPTTWWPSPRPSSPYVSNPQQEPSFVRPLASGHPPALAASPDRSWRSANALIFKPPSITCTWHLDDNQSDLLTEFAI